MPASEVRLPPAVTISQGRRHSVRGHCARLAGAPSMNRRRKVLGLFRKNGINKHITTYLNPRTRMGKSVALPAVRIIRRE